MFKLTCGKWTVAAVAAILGTPVFCDSHMLQDDVDVIPDCADNFCGRLVTIRAHVRLYGHETLHFLGACKLGFQVLTVIPTPRSSYSESVTDDSELLSAFITLTICKALESECTVPGMAVLCSKQED